MELVNNKLECFVHIYIIWTR